jgi:hypothetical protein
MSHIRAQAMPAAGPVALAWPGVPQTTPAGKDYFRAAGATGLTTSSMLAHENVYQNFPWVTVSTSATGGALDSSITPPPDNPTRQSTIAMVNLC